LNPNYSVTPTNGTLSIGQKAATVTANDKSKTYGDDNPLLDATVTGTVNGNTLNYTLATTAVKYSNVGSYPISVTLGSNPNYSVTPINGTLSIGQKAATVTANNKSKTYGDDNPALTATITGTVNGNALSYTLATTALKYSNVGSYPITVTLGSNPNYSVTPTDGTLSIGQKSATVTADNKNKAYGDDNPALTATVTGTVNGDVLSYTLATTAVKYSNAGTYPISVTLGTNPNYSVTPTNGTLTVNAKGTSVVSGGTGGSSGTQYSDRVTLSATVSPTSIGGSQITGSVTFTVAGEPAIAPVPIDASGNASVVVALTGQVTPVTATQISKLLTLSFTSSNPNFANSTSTDTVTETLENAKIDYTGDGLALTSTSSATSATVNLSAVVKEEADGYLGSKLNTTTLTFKIYKFTDTTMTTPFATCTTPVLTITAPGTANAGCSVSLAVDNYTVKISLAGNGYYTAPVETVAVTVAQPGTGFTTGGGWILEPTLLSKSNFGFTVKYLKNGNIQGNGLYIYRKTLSTSQVINGVTLPAGDYNWIIKSNAMTQMTQSCTPTAPKICTSTFTGKANITAVSRTTGLAYSLGGNELFQVDVTDNGEPGSSSSTTPDTYAIKVWDSSGTYYQLGSPTGQIALNGGNIQVRP
jgi:hypothetical protein